MFKWLLIIGINYCFLTSLNAVDELNVTVVEINSTCGLIQSDVEYTYDTWFSFCPAKTRPEAYEFMEAHNFYATQLPPCTPPSDPNLKDGVYYSEVVP